MTSRAATPGELQVRFNSRANLFGKLMRGDNTRKAYWPVIIQAAYSRFFSIREDATAMLRRISTKPKTNGTVLAFAYDLERRLTFRLQRADTLRDCRCTRRPIMDKNEGIAGEEESESRSKRDEFCLQVVVRSKTMNRIAFFASGAVQLNNRTYKGEARCATSGSTINFNSRRTQPLPTTTR